MDVPSLTLLTLHASFWFVIRGHMQSFDRHCLLGEYWRRCLRAPCGRWASDWPDRRAEMRNADVAWRWLPQGESSPSAIGTSCRHGPGVGRGRDAGAMARRIESSNALCSVEPSSRSRGSLHPSLDRRTVAQRPLCRQTQQRADRHVLVDVRPMDAFAATDQAPVGALCRRTRRASRGNQAIGAEISRPSVSTTRIDAPTKSTLVACALSRSAKMGISTPPGIHADAR